MTRKAILFLRQRPYPSERIPRVSSPSPKVKKPPLVTFASTHEGSVPPAARTTDDQTHQKHSHRSVSRAFKQLTSDLHRMNHETPFQAHLSKYHRHDHSKKNVAKWKGKIIRLADLSFFSLSSSGKTTSNVIEQDARCCSSSSSSN